MTRPVSGRAPMRVSRFLTIPMAALAMAAGPMLVRLLLAGG